MDNENNMMLNFLTKVVGVTYEGRQIILDYLCKNDPWRMLWLIHTLYHGEAAIQVMDISTRLIIGWIPQCDVQWIQQTGLYVLTGFIGFFNVYYVRLYVPIPPSPEQYQKVTELCHAMQRPLPIYDIRPYTLLLQKGPTNN